MNQSQDSQSSVLPPLVTLNGSDQLLSSPKKQTTINLSQDKKQPEHKPEEGQKDRVTQKDQVLIQKLEYFSSLLLRIDSFPPFIFTNFFIYLLCFFEGAYFTLAPHEDIQLLPVSFRAEKTNLATNNDRLLPAPLASSQNRPYTYSQLHDCLLKAAQGNQNNCGSTEVKRKVTQSSSTQLENESCHFDEQAPPINTTTSSSVSTKRYIPISITAGPTETKSQLEAIDLGSTPLLRGIYSIGSLD